MTRLTFMFAPLLYIFFSLQIFQANIVEFVCYTLTYLVSSFAMQSYLFGRVRWPWISELYEYVQSVMLFGAIISVVRNPRKPTFNVTAKGQTLETSKLSPLAGSYFAIFLLLLGATGYAVWRYLTEPMPSELLLIVIGWNLINTGLAGAALGVVSERRERRRNQRLSVQRHALVHIDQKPHAVIVRDVSSGGVGIEFFEGVPQGIRPDDTATLELRRQGKAMKTKIVCRVIRDDQTHPIFGFAFSERTPETFVMIAEMMYAEQARLQERITRRQKPIGFFVGTIQFAFWTLRQTLRAFGYALGAVRETTAPSHPDAELDLRAFGPTGPGHTGDEPPPASVKEVNYA
jgi:cellulose synthase (UDP-forming)